MMPPRHGKSELISKFFPAWWLGHRPDHRVLLASYEAAFAAGWGAKAREVLREQGRSSFGVELGREASTDWDLTRGGGMATAGVGGPLTGKGANLLLIDDPVKNQEEARSPTLREKLWDWFRSTAMTRLEPQAAAVVVMTRWHEDDLAGRILNGLVEGEGQSWRLVRLPALCEEDNPVERRIGRSIGDPLWPGRFPLPALQAIQRTLGSYWWSALYQQRPAPLAGSLFQQAWFRYYQLEQGEATTWFILLRPEGPKRVAGESCRRFITVDVAASTREQADYTVVSVWAVTPDTELLLLEVLRAKFEGPDQPGLIRQAYERWKASYIAVEKVGYQLTMMQTLKRSGLPVREAKGADKDKVARALVASARYEAGMVYHPVQAAWLAAFEGELLHFPNGRHDDQVDTVSYAAIDVAMRSQPRIRIL